MKQKLFSMIALLLTAATGAWAQWTGGTYTATANENVSAISVTSDATLTINEGVTVTANAGINAEGHTLTVEGKGTLIVKGNNGSNGSSAQAGGNGAAGVIGNLIVNGATVQITGGNGGNGGNGTFDANYTGTNGGNGTSGVTGDVTVKSGTVTITGGNGGRGGNVEPYMAPANGRNGGNGGYGVTGNVTVEGGTATIKGGNGGSGGNGFEAANGSAGSNALAYDGTLTLGASVTLYEGTNASGTVLDGNTGSSRVYSGDKKQNMYAESPFVSVTSISLDPATASMTLGGETLTLTPTVLPANATDKSVTWTSSDASVATVADGVVTAVAAGTATITATANDGSGVTGTCTVTVTDPATKYDLTVGENEHGTVAFTVDGAAATQAKKDDVVTVSVTPNEGYSTKDVTVRAYTTWNAAPARAKSRAAAPELVDDITVTPGENGIWTFTMPEANVWVVVTYTKNLQDAWIEAIADQTYTGEALTPAVVVKDGETTLALNTDYTVAYSDNTETGTATVTVTGTGDYSGTATATFIIRADKSDLNDAITAAEAYYESIKDSNPTAAAALKTAIDAAKEKQGNADASQDDVNNALTALTTAKTTAEETVLEETKNELGNAIDEAEAYYESIKDSNPEAAEALKTAIDAAKTAKDNGEATQEDIENALSAINNAKTTAEETVLEDTKNELGNAIDEAENYYNSIKDSNPEAAEALKDAIDAAKAAKENGEATQEDIDNALSAINNAKTTAEETVLEDTKGKLDDAITEAEAYYESIKDSNPEAAEALKEAIDAAKAAQENGDATQEDIDNALSAINNAKTTAEETVLTETKGELDDAITEAEAYYESIKDSNPEAAEALKEAIDAAKAAQENGDATQADVEAAIEAINNARNTATVEVSRVTITIPAKSYVARIDAENRKIETAVAGVSLYTVKNVSNTEVELTAELSVVAKEMPYLIYNDNDEEVTISIILTTEEADVVDYDDTHFFGTLTDKTFTDEDMQAADHYVLSNGHDFVWVKDAGTLAAGKCWIELVPSSPAHARRLSIVFEGETTGINAVSSAADKTDGEWYDLSGRRVAQPAKGIYVKNGKKVIVK